MKKILLLISIVFVSFACNEVFDISPSDKLSEADVWQDEALIRAYINSVYEQTFEQGLFRTTQIGSACDELHNIKAGRPGFNFHYVQQGIVTSDNVSNLGNYLSNWSDSYGMIRDINFFFQKMEESEIDETIKAEYIAEMKFIDAFIYFNLISRYGGVPIITHVYDLGEDYTVSRNTYAECVTHIITELDEIINGGALPDTQTGSDLGKISADAARALKARALLYAASPLNGSSSGVTWADARDAAWEIIEDGHYSLHSDYQDLFVSTSGAEEIIFARYFSQANSHQLSLQVGRCGDHGWGSDSPSQNLVDSYEMTDGSTFDWNNPVHAADPYANRDPRLHASILYNGSVWQGRATETFKDGLDSSTGAGDTWNASLSGYYLKKFVQEEIPPTGSSVSATSPWIMFRYGEVLLNYAEALFESGGSEDVVRQYLNMVRSRQGVDMPDVTATGDDLREAIQHERRIELAFEGHRYFDVRRWMIAGETESQNLMGMEITKETDGSFTYASFTLIQRAWDDKLYVLPIPQEEIDRSGGGLVQNSGYEID